MSTVPLERLTMSERACLVKLRDNPAARLVQQHGPGYGWKGYDAAGLLFWYPQRIESLFAHGLVSDDGGLTVAGQEMAARLPKRI